MTYNNKQVSKVLEHWLLITLNFWTVCVGGNFWPPRLRGKTFHPQRSPKILLIIYQVEYFLLEYCEYTVFHIPWLNLWGTSILWHKCYILLIGLFISSENTAIQQIFLIPTNSMLSQLDFFEIKRLPQLITLLKWFFIDLLLSKRLMAFVKRSKMLPNKKTDQETRKSWPNKRK